MHYTQAMCFAKMSAVAGFYVEAV